MLKKCLLKLGDVKMKKIITIIFFTLVGFSSYAKGAVLTLACMPPEGTMEEDAKIAYVNAVESAFAKSGHMVADRQRLQKLIQEIEFQKSMDETAAASEAGKIMKVDYLALVTVDSWSEEQVSSAAGARAAGNVLGALTGSSQTTVTSGESDLIKVENIRFSVKLIEVETSFILASSTTEGKRKDSVDKLATKIVKDIEKQLKKKKK